MILNVGPKFANVPFFSQTSWWLFFAVEGDDDAEARLVADEVTLMIDYRLPHFVV